MYSHEVVSFFRSHDLTQSVTRAPSKPFVSFETKELPLPLFTVVIYLLLNLISWSSSCLHIILLSKYVEEELEKWSQHLPS